MNLCHLDQQESPPCLLAPPGVLARHSHSHQDSEKRRPRKLKPTKRIPRNKLLE